MHGGGHNLLGAGDVATNMARVPLSAEMDDGTQGNTPAAAAAAGILPWDMPGSNFTLSRPRCRLLLPCRLHLYGDARRH